MAGALKLVGEAFPWQDGSEFVYTQDNHNSVLGIRELALDQGATATCVEFDADNGMLPCIVSIVCGQYLMRHPFCWYCL